ncbi:MAG: hypothetical protein KatS3mg129_1623 [Leptospiraceae bacterium]|nr:MAG: hypothetical protein KatS3mg129_1623 [Leptospiraceae bacterium]
MDNEIELIEWEIEELINKYLSPENEKYWDSHLLKLKNKKNIYILRPKYFMNKSPFLFTNEQFAHYYSLLDLPDISFIEKIIFLPKFIEIDHYFLTNLYIIENHTLIFYLSPLRLYFSSLPVSEIYKEIQFAKEIAKERIVLEEKFFTKFQNLFYMLELINQKNLQQNTKFYKFIEDKENVSYLELEEMRKINDFFLLRHPLSKI